MALKLRKLSYPLGAEVCDVDVAKPMSEQSFGEIYRAFLDNGILLFRNQDITREQHIEFSRRFGELDRHDSLPRDRRKDHPELLMVTNEPKPDGSPSDTKYTGRQWHSDMSFTTEPSLGSLLRSFAVPEVGGDTLFANMYMAYDTLSAGMKNQCRRTQRTRACSIGPSVLSSTTISVTSAGAEHSGHAVSSPISSVVMASAGAAARAGHRTGRC